MSILNTLLDQRDVKFTSLTIIIHEGECTEDDDGEITFGQTLDTTTTQTTVDIYLKHHISDLHVLGDFTTRDTTLFCGHV